VMEKRLNVRVPKDIYDQVVDIAVKENTSVGTIVREIVEDYLEFGPEKEMYDRDITKLLGDKERLFEANKTLLKSLDSMYDTVATFNRMIITILNACIPVLEGKPECWEAGELVKYLNRIKIITEIASKNTPGTVDE